MQKITRQCLVGIWK